MKISRRDILKFAVGSAAGIMLTPVPWKVLDDSAIWTQNWPWIPVPRKGETTTRFTTCTLCPAGCGIKARCIAGQPVSLTGVAAIRSVGDALSHRPRGTPSRISPGQSLYIPAPVNEIRYGRIQTRLRSMKQQGPLPEPSDQSAAGESVALLDQQPGRSISLFYRRISARLPRGVYLRAPWWKMPRLPPCTSMLGIRKRIPWLRPGERTHARQLRCAPVRRLGNAGTDDATGGKPKKERPSRRFFKLRPGNREPHSRLTCGSRSNQERRERSPLALHMCWCPKGSAT